MNFWILSLILILAIGLLIFILDILTTLNVFNRGNHKKLLEDIKEEIEKADKLLGLCNMINTPKGYFSKVGCMLNLFGVKYYYARVWHDTDPSKNSVIIFSRNLTKLIDKKLDELKNKRS